MCGNLTLIISLHPSMRIVDTHSGNTDDFVLWPVHQIPHDNDAEPAQTLHDRFSAISSGGTHYQI